MHADHIKEVKDGGGYSTWPTASAYALHAYGKDNDRASEARALRMERRLTSIKAKGGSASTPTPKCYDRHVPHPDFFYFCTVL